MIEQNWKAMANDDSDVIQAFSMTAADLLNAAAEALDDVRNLALAEQLNDGGRVEVAWVAPDGFVIVTMVTKDGERLPVVVAHEQPEAAGNA